MKIKTEVKIFLTFFLVYAYFMHWPGWNEYSTLALTTAIVEYKTTNIDASANLTGDRTYYNGHYYSSKAPGLSLLILPSYFITYQFKDILKDNYYPIQQIISTMISSVITALSVVIIYLICKRNNTEKRKTIIITTACGLGTLILTHGTFLSKHAVSATLLLIGYYLINSKNNKKNNITAGILAGFAGITEYSVIIIALCLIVYASYKNKKIAIYLIIGSLIGIAPALIYHYISFGNPFTVALNYPDAEIWKYDPVEVSSNYGFRGFLPNIIIMIRLLAYPEKGLLFYSPILILSLISLMRLIKEKNENAIFILSTILLYLAVFSQYEEWGGGYSFSSRFTSVLTPFFILPLIYDKKINIDMMKTFAIISIVVSSTSLIGFEDTLTDINTLRMKDELRAKENTLLPLANPIFDFYLPNFVKTGPRSRILENIYYHEKIININDTYQKTINPIITMTPVSIGLLLIWKRKLFRIAGTII